jgi:hypothetical protein
MSLTDWYQSWPYEVKVGFWIAVAILIIVAIVAVLGVLAAIIVPIVLSSMGQAPMMMNETNDTTDFF